MAQSSLTLKYEQHSCSQACKMLSCFIRGTGWDPESEGRRGTGEGQGICVCVFVCVCVCGGYATLPVLHSDRHKGQQYYCRGKGGSLRCTVSSKMVLHSDGQKGEPY